MEISAKRTVLHFIAAVVLAVVSYIPIAVICSLLDNAGMDIGHAMIVLLALVCGYPLGSTLGIVLLDKLLFKTKPWNPIGTCVSLFLAFLGGVFGFIMLDIGGGIIFVLTPLLTAFLALVGYFVPLIMRGRGPSQPP